MNAAVPSSSPSGEMNIPDELRAVFRDAEARHLTAEELRLYERLLPDWSERADAARAAYANEIQVVEDTIESIFEVYPYSEHHALHAEKCPRDVTNVSTYAIQAMLMNDNAWYRDKLLLWLKTILQAFRFPARSQPKATVLFGNDAETEIINSLPQGRQSLYETYLLLDRNYEQVLSEAHYELLHPHFETAKSILGGE